MNRHVERTRVALEKAVRANVALWQALRELELIVGFDFDSQAYICELTLEVDSGGNVTHGDAAELLRYLQQHHGIDQAYGPN